jgi:membrane-bound lytic murein transglycosylase F
MTLEFPYARIHSTAVALLLAWFAITAGCSDKPRSRLEQIWDAGRIVMITDKNAHNYYQYRRQPTGFEYELAKAFADYLGVDLQVVTPGWNKMFASLNSGAGDFIAAGITKEPYWRKFVDFSDAYLESEQNVIVHMDNRGIRTMDDLSGKEVHVKAGTTNHQRLAELNDDGYDIRIVAHNNATIEDMIRRVARGEIDITIADSQLAFLNQRYYPAIRKAFTTPGTQRFGWAVRKGDRQLADIINAFFARTMREGKFAQIRDRYYANMDRFDYFELKKFHERVDSRMPSYRSIIMREARRYDFDWRLVAALIYQESHFDPQAISYTGVRGLMQLTLETAGDLGIEDRRDPVESIGGGIKYLKWLYHLFDDIPGFDRMLFALASYNIGYGHVRDAQEIARNKGLEHNRWIALKRTLPLLSRSAYYRQTTYGFARGNEPVRYVDRIVTYYDILRRKALGLG